MFSLFDAVMLRLLPVRDPQQLYLVRETESVEAVSFPMFQRFRDALQGTADVLRSPSLRPSIQGLGAPASRP